MDDPPIRASSRAKKPTERFDSYSSRIDDTDNSGGEEEELLEEEKTPEKFEDPNDKIDWAEMEGEEEAKGDESPKPEKVKKTRRKSEKVRIRHNFTIEERSRVFQHVLDECRSKVPGREGRIAKYKVQTANGWVWEKFIQKYGYTRDLAVYRLHYDYHAKKLHTVPGLTLDERVDLYYAMDIPITDPKEKAIIIKQYGATVDEKNIITGSTVCTHWDLEHSASEEEDGPEDTSHFIRDTTRYVEYHDGAMWQFIVDLANSTPEAVDYGFSTWDEFKQQHRSPIFTKKSTMSLMTRFKKIQLPNLHIMPFDIETKAALYESLGYPVPLEFREELTSATGAILTSYGYVEEYPNRPIHLVLQSKPYLNSKIKLSSTTRFSTLRELEEKQVLPEDRRPWTIQEDREIWEHIRSIATKQPYGIVRKLHVPKSGQNFFWWKCSEQMKMAERGCVGMAKNFKRLRANILTSEYDLKTKIELFYIVCEPLGEDAIEQFKTISILVLNENRTIRYAIGEDWMVGRSTDAGTKNDDIFSFHYDDEQLQQILQLDDDEMRPDADTPSTSSAPPPMFNVSTASYRIMEHVYRFEAAEKIVLENLSRSQRFPYVDHYHRSKLYLKRHRQQIREGICQSPPRPPVKEPRIEKPEMEIEQDVYFEHEVKMEPVEDYELVDALGEEQYYVDEIVEEVVERPPILYPKPTTSVTAMEYAFGELQKVYDAFHQTLQDGSHYFDEHQLAAYKAEMERLANSFRQSGKNALTDDGEFKWK